MTRRWRWKTTRSATAEYGPPPGALYREQLAAYSDAELVARGRDAVLAEIREQLRFELRRAQAEITPHRQEITR